MKNITITYSKNTLPYIQITFNGLVVNRDYIHDIDSEYLKAILYSEGYEDVSDSLIEQIKAYSISPEIDKDVTVVF